MSMYLVPLGCCWHIMYSLCLVLYDGVWQAHDLGCKFSLYIGAVIVEEYLKSNGWKLVDRKQPHETFKKLDSLKLNSYKLYRNRRVLKHLGHPITEGVFVYYWDKGVFISCSDKHLLFNPGWNQLKKAYLELNALSSCSFLPQTSDTWNFYYSFRQSRCLSLILVCLKKDCISLYLVTLWFRHSTWLVHKIQRNFGLMHTSLV